MDDAIIQIRQLFHERGLRCTRQREDVYRALMANCAHPTAEELFSGLRDSTRFGLSLATVYNTLEALCACGLVRRVPAADGRGPCRYDADTKPHVHVSMPDGRVVDLPDHLGERLLEALERALDGGDLRETLGADVGDLTLQVVAHPRSRSS